MLRDDDNADIGIRMIPSTFHAYDFVPREASDSALHGVAILPTRFFLMLVSRRLSAFETSAFVGRQGSSDEMLPCGHSIPELQTQIS